MMKKINYLLVFVSVFALNLQAQDWSLKLSSNVEIRTWKLSSTYEKEERSLGGASIVLTKVGQIVAQTTSDGSGDFTIMVPPNGEYILTVSYPGYNTKRFSVNTNDVPAEYAKDNYKPTFSIGGFIMAKPFPGIDYSGLQQPLVRVQFMPKKKLFDHDDIVTDQGLAIVSKIAAAENALIQSFCSTNKAGDVALAKPDCPLAKTLYEKAMTIIPGEQYPVQQLAKVGECLKAKDDAAKKAAEDAANKALAEKAAAEKAAEKAKTNAEAKALADKKAKEEAEANKVLKEKAAAEQANAEKAAKQKAENDRLEKEKAAAEKLAKQKEGLAKSQAEDEAEAKAIEEKRKEKEAREKEAMAKAKAEDEAAAKALAEKKAAKEKEAKEKSAKEKEAMAKAKAEDEAEAKALEEKRKAERIAKEEEAKKLQHETKSSDSEGEMAKGNSKYSTPQALGVDKYKVGIKKADDYFKMKRWAEAKTAYEDVLKIRAGDPYATSKLEIVNKNLSTPK